MVLIWHFIEEFIVKFWSFYEHNDFLAAFILNTMTFTLNLLSSVWRNNLNLMNINTKTQIQLWNIAYQVFL